MVCVGDYRGDNAYVIFPLSTLVEDLECLFFTVERLAEQQRRKAEQQRMSFS